MPLYYSESHHNEDLIARFSYNNARHLRAQFLRHFLAVLLAVVFFAVFVLLVVLAFFTVVFVLLVFVAVFLFAVLSVIYAYSLMRQIL